MSIHPYFSHPEIFYQTQKSLISFPGLDLTIEEIKDLDQCIDLQCDYIRQNPLPSPYLGVLEDFCPYFAKIWDCSKNLAYWSIENKNLFKNKNIIEIGPGLAIPSFVLTKLGFTLRATDYHPHSQYFANQNMKLNHLNFSYTNQSWKDLCQENEVFDIVIASDILYEGKYVQDLIQFCRQKIAPQGQLILADPLRGYLQTFINQAEEYFEINLTLIKYFGSENFLLNMKRR